ncbi:transposase, partial [Hafnia alvei]|nr:transposase [Hafnia alvei]
DLTWPVPGSMTCRKLEKILYPQRLLASPLAPDISVPVPSETLSSGKHRRRPNFPREFKIALVERSLQPDVSVALLARENGINANLLFNWRHLYRKGLSKGKKAHKSRHRSPTSGAALFSSNRYVAQRLQAEWETIPPSGHDRRECALW